MHGIAALSLAYFVAIPWYPNHWLSVFIAIVRYGAALVFIVFVLFILVIDGSPTPLEISLPKEFQCTTRTFGMVPSAGEEVSLVKPIFPGAYILVSKQTIMDYENEGLSADKICTELLKAHINQR